MTRVIVCRLGLPPEVEELPDASSRVAPTLLLAMQRIVGGYVELAPFSVRGMDLWCGEENDEEPINWVFPAEPRAKPPAFRGFKDVFVIDARSEDGAPGAAYGEPGVWPIRGPFLFARHDDKGDTTSVTDEDVAWVNAEWERMRLAVRP